MPVQSIEITAPPEKPVAVVDIGSNSVRLVVYDRLSRAPSPIFNEKVLCGLGKGVAITGLLAEQGILRALNELRRFKALCKLIGVTEIFAVATAAAREAKNGPEFIRQAEKALGAHVEVLTGMQEAEYAALGVFSGIPNADGVVGDLGGGSLELVDIRDGKLGQGITLPLGALRLMDMSGGSFERAREIIDETLSRVDLVDAMQGRDFYAVGGTWRNLARLHMAQTGYPLHVLHQYAVPGAQAGEFAAGVVRQSAADLREIGAVSKSRAETLPLGALVLERLMLTAHPRAMVVSVFGVREGLLYKRLKKRRQGADALLSAAWDFTRRYARSPEHERELCDWTDQIFGTGELPETHEQRRLRHAACLMADIGWRAHPDYRGERSLTIISQAAFVGVDHPGRLFLALSVFYRYEGPGNERAPEDFRRLVGKDMLKRAELLAAAMRLAYVITAAMPGVLPKVKVSFSKGGNLVLKVPPKFADLMGERVEKRLQDLARMLGCTPAVEI